MHTTLRFRHRHTLHTMHPRLILHDAIHVLARHTTDDFLVAAHGTLGEGRHGEVPAFHFAVFRVHPEQVASKESRLVATRTATYFQRHVLAVLWVGRDEQEFDFLLQFRDALLVGGDFLARHLLHLGVIFQSEQFLRLLQSLGGIDVFLSGLHDVLQVLVFLRQLHIPLLVGNHVRVGDEGRDLLKSRHQPLQFFQYRIFCCHSVVVLGAKLRKYRREGFFLTDFFVLLQKVSDEV